MDDSLLGLTDTFRRLGANDPEGWARSQINEGIPQLHRFLFLKAAWSHVVEDDDTSWIEQALAPSRRNDDPGASLGPALRRLLDAGARPEDISEVVRVTQWQLLFEMCYQLDDSGVIDTLSREGEMPEIAWGLFAIDEDGNPLDAIDALHESVLAIDPTGREMRPREAP